VNRTPGAPLPEAGYALVAAIAGLLVFSALALSMMSATRLATSDVQAFADRTRLSAAVEGGLALAAYNLSIRNRADRWSIDGRTRTTTFDGLAIAITVEDETGKIPYGLLEESQMRLMYELAGASGERLDILTDSTLDWIDEDDETRPFGAESAYYAKKSYVPRNGKFASVGELINVRGMDAALLARLAPALTVWFGQGTQAERDRNANPFALAVMSGAGLNSPGVIQRQRELAGQRTAIELGEAESIIGKPLMVQITASDGNRARFSKKYIIELTGNSRRPYLVRDIW
jgi:general secretion pathway protein K